VASIVHFRLARINGVVKGADIDANLAHAAFRSDGAQLNVFLILESCSNRAGPSD
jgi:hypothetical protein